MSNDIIYGLYYLEGDKKCWFYCGITDNFDRRFPDHQTNFRDEYVEKKRAGQKKVGKYGDASQLAVYVFARKVCASVEDMYGEVLCDAKNEFTESYVAVKMIRDGHDLHQDESKLLRWQRIANDENYKVRSEKDIENWKPYVDKDETEVLIEQMKYEGRLRNEFVDALRSGPWVAKKKTFGKLTITRGKRGTGVIGETEFYVTTGEIYGTGKTYKDAYKDLAVKIVKEVLNEQT